MTQRRVGDDATTGVAEPDRSTQPEPEEPDAGTEPERAETARRGGDTEPLSAVEAPADRDSPSAAAPPRPVGTPAQVPTFAPAPSTAQTGTANRPQPVPMPAVARPAPTKAGNRRPSRSRRARLRLVRLDPWSVMKMSFLFSIAIGIVTVVAVAVVWSVLDAGGVWDSINTTVQGVLSGAERRSFDVLDWLSLERVLGFATLVACVDVVLITAISTLVAFLYNIAAGLLGGIDVTLADD